MPHIGGETLLSNDGGTPVPSSTQLNHSVEAVDRIEEEEVANLEIVNVTPTVLDPGPDVVFTQVESSHVETPNE